MKRHLRLIALSLLFIAIPLLKAGCGAAPPAPPLEIPSPAVLKFVQYEDIKIDFSTISSADAQMSISKAVGSGDYAPLITIGVDLLSAEEEIIATLLSGLSSIEIPVGEEVTTFEGAMTSVDENGNERSFAAKLDFADFDLDGVNGTEGCSGHTAALPVCVRTWIDGKRALAWVFDAYPFPETDTKPANPGASRFRVDITAIRSDADIMQQTINFDHQDLEQRSTEFFLHAEILGADGILNSEEEVIEYKHTLATQTGPDASAIKLLNLDLKAQSYNGSSIIQYLGQFQEGADFWSGSILDSTGETPEVENLCVRISTADETAQSNCDLLGISVAGIDFVEPAQDSDVAFYDFPEEPTF